jgi:hypothetical protein
MPSSTEPSQGVEEKKTSIFCRLFVLSALAGSALLYNKVITNHTKSGKLVRDSLFRDNLFKYSRKKERDKTRFHN